MFEQLEYRTKVEFTDPLCLDPPRCSKPSCRSTDIRVERSAASIIVVCQVCQGRKAIPCQLLTVGEREWLKQNKSN